ncbi:unnamed protein product [Phytophthora fragariaefolia]|uniref:Unnamed protein product n=1 Tax=Phytophthora fragariaefolia TaxID=1490495 RepID=A0A9W7CZT8_9STRA|nr:unnamed protein product [Phytophthora fragariaefolia]
MEGNPVHQGKGVPRFPPWLQKALKVKEETEKFWTKQHQAGIQQQQSRPKTSDLASTAQATALKQAAEHDKKVEPFVNVWVSIAADDAQGVKTFLEEDINRFFIRKDYLCITEKGVEGGGGGETLLHEASYLGSVAVVRLLVGFMQTHFTPEICLEVVNAIDTQRHRLQGLIRRHGGTLVRSNLSGLAAPLPPEAYRCCYCRVFGPKLQTLQGESVCVEFLASTMNIYNLLWSQPLDIAQRQVEHNRCLSSITVHELLLGVNPTCNLRIKMLAIKRNEDFVRARESVHIQENLASVMEVSGVLVPAAEKMWRETMELAERRRKAEVQQHINEEVKAAGAAAREWLETKEGKLFVKKQIPLAIADIKQAMHSGKIPKPKDLKTAALQRVQDLYCVEKEQSAKKSATESFVAQRPPYPRDRVTELRRMLHL